MKTVMEMIVPIVMTVVVNSVTHFTDLLLSHTNNDLICGVH